MMTDNFDPFSGSLPNGWGDGPNASFGGTQATTARQNEYSRFPLPVTVATLKALPSGAEDIKFGNYTFSTIHFVGEIVEVTLESNNVRYLVKDVGIAEQEPVTVVQYLGVDNDETVTTPVEGSKVHVVGKMRSFDGETAMNAFNVSEVTSADVLETFPLEARLSQLFFEKDLPARIAAGQDMSMFRGTMLSTEPPENIRPNGPPGSAATTPMRPTAAAPNVNASMVYGSTQSFAGASGLSNQQARIIDFLKKHTAEEGAHLDAIKSAVNGDANFQADLDKLNDDGVIFSTIDDFHYSFLR